MAKPVIVIRSQLRVNKTITITGYVTGSPTSVTASLPAAAVPNGAISQPASAVTLNPDGEFVKTFSTLNYGDYDPAIFTATNAAGTTTATTMPMRLFVPGTSAVGTPRVLFPDFVAPVFAPAAAKVAIGAEVTSITLESDSPSNQINVPFKFGQPFKEGDLSPSDFLVGKTAGQADVPLQFNVKATHPDGSVRHAIISGVLPSLATAAQRILSLVRSVSGASTAPQASNAVTAAGFTAAVNITMADGKAYSADAAPVLAAGIATSKAWISGAIANEYSVNIPFKDVQGVDHPFLTAQFNVCHFSGVNKAKVDVVVEHTKAYTATTDLSYSGEVRVGNVAVLQITGSSGQLVHFPTARWVRTFWWGHTNPVHIRHNVPYFIGTKQVPNYDQSVVIPESVLAGYVTDMTKPEFTLMGRGLIGAVFGAQGGRPELGLQPSWYAAYLLSQDKRAKKMMLALAECAASFRNAHRRDDSNGPFQGQPLDVIHFPDSTLLGTAADSKNGATGLAEKFPALTTTSTLQPDASHQPNFAYLPYLVTGDIYHLEELHFWVNFNNYANNPGYRDGANALLYPDQVRGQSWSMRTLAECAAVTPDNHPAKQQLNFWLANNLNWYNKTFTDNPAVNKLGIMTQGAIVYRNGEVPAKTRIGNFQDDFNLQCFNHVRELGFKPAARYVLWKAKWQVDRILTGCWIDACYYDPRVRLSESSPMFETMGEVWANTFSAAARALPCDSYERYAQIETDEGRVPSATKWKKGAIGGYPDWGMGFAANYQPALAAAVDIGYPGAADAWLVYSNRSVKQDFGTDPQFAVVPRGYVAATDPIPTDPTDPTPPGPTALPVDSYSVTAGDIMYFGMSPP